MARGHQKEQAKQKNLEKQQKLQKAGSQLEAQKVGLKISCKLCLVYTIALIMVVLEEINAVDDNSWSRSYAYFISLMVLIKLWLS
ncbi:unnamed protein product [Amoebophrya sp. A120]|nr:unnamed protein product [Amoebophrya sp. A120]|eukprot:GSA120T00015121001.1